jgi:hypothetical protein
MHEICGGKTRLQLYTEKINFIKEKLERKFCKNLKHYVITNCDDL